MEGTKTLIGQPPPPYVSCCRPAEARMDEARAGDRQRESGSTRRADGSIVSAPVTVVIADDHAVVRDGLRALIAAQPGMKVVGEAADEEEPR